MSLSWTSPAPTSFAFISLWVHLGGGEDVACIHITCALLGGASLASSMMQMFAGSARSKPTASILGTMQGSARPALMLPTAREVPSLCRMTITGTPNSTQTPLSAAPTPLPAGARPACLYVCLYVCWLILPASQAACLSACLSACYQFLTDFSFVFLSHAVLSCMRQTALRRWSSGMMLPGCSAASSCYCC